VKKIVESVPNFSEGRRKEVVDALAAALTGVAGVALLDTEMDAAHNRCVISVAGEPEAVAKGVIEAVGKAAELIDLRQHKGEHPRMGAADVIPFIPISGMSIEECVELSVRVAQAIAERYRIPTYLYEQSARIPARRDLAYVRKGQFEAIREEIRTRPERKPDFGPCEVHPSAGASAVGARFPLIAYNIYLRTTELKIAREIARAIRSSSGGFRYVKAMGFQIEDRNQVQVSMNLTNYEATPLFRVFDLVCREAERYGVSIASSEIIGLIPQKALDASAEYYLRLENFSRNQILENRLTEALSRQPAIEEFILNVAKADPLLPAGGSVAALAGSLAAALGEMMSSLTEGREKFAPVDSRVRQIHARLSACREALRALVQEDSEAFRSLFNAVKLPKANEHQIAARAEAIERTTRIATETPLRTARAASEVLMSLRELVDIGNPNAWSDAAVGAQMAYASLKGAQYNVLTNIGGIKDKVFAENCRTEVSDLVGKGQGILQQIDEIVAGDR
jgi:glutamate formiminotransferase/formiminotetrahydrofolate cyclodeaminase